MRLGLLIAPMLRLRPTPSPPVLALTSPPSDPNHPTDPVHPEHQQTTVARTGASLGMAIIAQLRRRPKVRTPPAPPPAIALPNLCFRPQHHGLSLAPVVLRSNLMFCKGHIPPIKLVGSFPLPRTGRGSLRAVVTSSLIALTFFNGSTR